MGLRQGHRITHRFRATVLSAFIAGSWLALMSPAVEAAVLQSKGYEYDARGRVTAEKDAANNVIVSYTYDGNGNRTTRTDALNRVTTYEYDALNRLTKVIDPASGTTLYSYDGRDNLVTVTDPRGLTTTYTYNGLDQLLSQASPDTGTTSYTPNAAGQVTTRTNAANQATTYQYDALGRVSQASYADGRVVSYSYDQGTHGQGRLTGMSDSESSLSWTFDAEGRVLSRTQVIGTGPGAQSQTLTYAYNSAGQLASLTYPSGAVITYTYDDQGRVASLSRNGVPVLSNIQYRPFGGITGWTWGNGQLHTRTYDQDGRLDLLSVGGTVHDQGYDAVSRITAIQDLADSSKNKTFSYDALDRLTGYTGQNSTRSWGYDAVGNRTSQSIGTTSETYVYASASNRLQSLTNSANSQQNRSYQYTSTGHTSSNGVNSFTYDARERLVSVTTPGANATYTLNPLGQRIQKSVTQGGATTTTTFLYDEAGHLVAEGEGSGGGSEYLYLGDIPVALHRVSVQTSQGTPVVVDPVSAFAYGNQWGASAPGATYQYYGSNYSSKSATPGAPQGVLVEDENALNTAPNNASRSGQGGWSGLTVQYYATPDLKAKSRWGQLGAHQGAIIDNTAATFTGTWSTISSCSSNCQGSGYRSAVKSTTGSPTATATWTHNVAVAGEYEISAYVVQSPTQASNPHYTLQYGSTTTDVTATLTVGTKSGGQWVSLGIYQLPAGVLSVTLDNVADISPVVADAIMVGPTSAPLDFNRFIWTANLPEAGTYSAYARIGCGPVTGQPWTTTAHYELSTAQGMVESTVDQNVYWPGYWRLLGTYEFNAGLNTVKLRDESPRDRGVCADAVVLAKPDAEPGYFNDAIWTPSLPAAGTYEVQAWWPNRPTNAVSTAWFRVFTAQGPVKVVKDQTVQAGQWVTLGQFELNPATAKVTLADYGAQGKHVYADAVRFVPVSTSTSSALYYIHPDHLNTPRQLTTSDIANTVVWRWDSEPFGSTLADADPDQNGQALAFNLRFPGQYFDAETQLHYNYFRDYDPGTGRYIESDPIGLEGGLNTYAYVKGDPVQFSDPLGLIPGGGSISAPWDKPKYEWPLPPRCETMEECFAKAQEMVLKCGVNARCNLYWRWYQGHCPNQSPPASCKGKDNACLIINGTQT